MIAGVAKAVASALAIHAGPLVIEGGEKPIWVVVDMGENGLGDGVVGPMPGLFHVGEAVARLAIIGLEKPAIEGVLVEEAPIVMEGTSLVVDPGGEEAKDVDVGAPVMARETGGGGGLQDLDLALSRGQVSVPAALVVVIVGLPPPVGGEIAEVGGLGGDTQKGAARKFVFSVPDMGLGVKAAVVRSGKAVEEALLETLVLQGGAG